ncbi:MAG: class I SAM-dependent methyltransferase [Peptococcaceae bacterium]|jgi:tRNA (adenine22-N1)-methyltransferase|nr:class I SAM-dependent methyltransferase [Peptococcaceae bacterium]
MSGRIQTPGREIHLEPRLKQVAEYVPTGARLADIGTDHAYLPIYLTKQGRIHKAVAVDVHAGPYQAARLSVAAHGLRDSIDVRLGDGLQVIQPGEVDVLTLAGMGGVKILEILNAEPAGLRTISRLIVQPQGGVGRVRAELCRSGWKIWRECLVEEEGRIYTVIAFTWQNGWSEADIGREVEYWRKLWRPQWACGAETAREREQRILAGIIWRMGPLILRQGDPCLDQVLAKRIEQCSRQVQGLDQARVAQTAGKAAEVRLEIGMLRARRAALGAETNNI